MPRNQRVRTLLLGLLSVGAMSVCTADSAAQQRLSQYRIEPPDLLAIKVSKLVPLKSYRLEAYDVLKVQVAGTLKDQPIDGDYLIEAEGIINLGPAYGTVRVAGMTIEEAKTAVTNQLLHTLREPQVSLEVTAVLELQAYPDGNGRCQFLTRREPTFLVQPDGTISLQKYGTVRVQGKTLAEAKTAIDKHLSQFFQSIETTVDLAGYNTKVYYVVTEDNITRVPLKSGKETVADALRQLGDLPQSSVVKVWVARPPDNGLGCDTLFHIDWSAAARGPNQADTVRLLPGDRVFVEERPVQVAKPAEKVYRPVEPRRRLASRRYRS